MNKKIILSFICLIFLIGQNNQETCSEIIDAFEEHYVCLNDQFKIISTNTKLFYVQSPFPPRTKIIKSTNCETTPMVYRVNQQHSMIHKIESPNVVSEITPTLVRYGNHCLFVLEASHHQTLEEYWEHNKLMDYDIPSSVLEIFYQIVKAVNAVHEKGIIIGDLRMGNILITNENEVVLFDFDSAIYGPQEIREFKSNALYTDPVQISQRLEDGWIQFDYSTDVYSLGIILYKMLFRKYPFETPDSKNIYTRIRRGDYTIKKECRLELVFLVFHLLSYDVNKRPTVKELLKWVTFIYRNVNKRKDPFVLVEEDFHVKMEFPQEAFRGMGIWTPSNKFVTLEESGLLDTDQELKRILKKKAHKNTVNWNDVSVDGSVIENSVEVQPSCGFFGIFGCFQRTKDEKKSKKGTIIDHI